jgi:uncharacterized protein
MFPLERVLMPGSALPLHVFEERYRIMTRECLAGEQAFGVVLIERGREVGGGDERVDVGTMAVIEEVAELEAGRFFLLCRGGARLRVVEWLPDDPYPTAKVTLAPDDADDPEVARLSRAEQSVRHVWALLSELGAASPLDPARDSPGLDERLAGLSPAEAAWAWCDLAPLTELDRLRLLDTDGQSERLRLLCDLVAAVAGDAEGLLAGPGEGLDEA